MKTLKTNLFLMIIVSLLMSCSKDEDESFNSNSISETEEIDNFLKSEDPADIEPDCSVFKGVEIRTLRNGKVIAFVKTLSLDVDDSSVVWTINGESVNPRRPRFVILNDHLTSPGTVEICYQGNSSSCDQLRDCTITEFKPVE